MESNENKANQDGSKSSDLATITISKKSLRNALIVVGGVLLVAALIVSGIFISDSMKPSKLTQAVEDCTLKINSDVSLDPDGKSLFLNGQGSKGTGLAPENLSCLIYALNLPKSVIERMNTTTALMGTQTADFEGMHIEWTYHPDNGLDISFTY